MSHPTASLHLIIIECPPSMPLVKAFHCANLGACQFVLGADGEVESRVHRLQVRVGPLQGQERDHPPARDLLHRNERSQTERRRS